MHGLVGVLTTLRRPAQDSSGRFVFGRINPGRAVETGGDEPLVE